jgi:hypothetical protein
MRMKMMKLVRAAARRLDAFLAVQLPMAAAFGLRTR